MKKKKFCMIEGGMHKVYYSSYLILNELFDLTVIARNNVKDLNVKVVTPKTKKIITSSFYNYKGIYKLLKKIDPDKISIKPYYRLYSFIALVYAIFNKKDIFIIEEQQNDPHKNFEKIFFRTWLFIVRPFINMKVKKVICMTKPCHNYMKKRGFKRLVYIPVSYSPKKGSGKSNNKQNKLNIICVARFEWLKAHHILIKAIAYLINSKKLDKKDININLVGDGSLINKMKKLCKKLDVQDVFNFKGKISNEKLDNYYQKHNLFILPSVSEPIGVVVFEAMSNGLPIIVSSNTGAKGSVYNGKNGYIFKNGDYKDLASKILKMKDPNKRQRFGKNSIKILKKDHSKKTILKKYKKNLGL